jgi:hypothetical protein
MAKQAVHESELSSASEAPELALANALLGLCGQVLPIWQRQLESTRIQAEQAVATMLSAFSVIGPRLRDAAHAAHDLVQGRPDGQSPMGLQGLLGECLRELEQLRSDLLPDSVVRLQRATGLVRQGISACDNGMAALVSLGDPILAESIEQMYVGFQFQDRINQILALVQEDLCRLDQALQALEPDVQVLDAREWLQRLQSMYATAEQRQAHGVEAGEAGDEISFF